jgi:hypothetical protein
MNFDLKELQLIREALDEVVLRADHDTVHSVIKKVEGMLEKEGYKWVRKAFHNEWKKIKNK